MRENWRLQWISELSLLIYKIKSEQKMKQRFMNELNRTLVFFLAFQFENWKDVSEFAYSGKDMRHWWKYETEYFRSGYLIFCLMRYYIENIHMEYKNQRKSQHKKKANIHKRNKYCWLSNRPPGAMKLLKWGRCLRVRERVKSRTIFFLQFSNHRLSLRLWAKLIGIVYCARSVETGMSSDNKLRQENNNVVQM